MSMSFLRDQIIGIVRRSKADGGVGVVKTVVLDHHWNVDDDDDHDFSSLGLRGGGGRRRMSEQRESSADGGGGGGVGGDNDDERRGETRRWTLSCKPYSFHIQRARLIHCFEAWGRYGDAEIEGFSVLESLRGIEIGGTGSKLVKKKFQYVPNLGNESVDHEFAFLDVEIVVTLVKCVSMKQSKEEGHYRRVLTLVDEVSPWFRCTAAATDGQQFQTVFNPISARKTSAFAKTVFNTLAFQIRGEGLQRLRSVVSDSVQALLSLHPFQQQERLPNEGRENEGKAMG
ncbi:hypothetical protein CsSME_00029689 [Camellia sinensis var. sinensis]